MTARAATRHRAWAAGVAVLLAVGLTLAPPAAGPAAAATGRLLVSSAATYTVDPSAGVVHVVDVVNLSNDKPSDAGFLYFWREVSWYVQPEATRIAARDPDGSLGVTPLARGGYVEVVVRLRRDLLFGQSIDVTISWDLPAGGPRTGSSIRVGAAFVAFELWASGDPGSSSVRAVLPEGFEVQTYGSTVETATGPDGVAVSAGEIGDPASFWVAVTATRDSAMTTVTVNPSEDASLVVRGWPEDEAWRTTVTTTLDRGLPELLELIGLPWPVSDALEVTEIYSPLLEGYAGLYYTEEDRIEISEDLDTLVIIHELSHAWFNDGLFSGRWISEGQADTYAAVTLEALGEERQVPDRPLPGDDGEVDLMAWGAPQRINEETEAREIYAYNASWFVTNELYDEIGPLRMRAVLDAADEDLIAYRGDGPAEHVPAADDWRRYLDLLEEVGGSTSAEDLFREYVVTPTAERELDARASAREAYAELVDEGADWVPPVFVRSELGSWRFALARSRISEAVEILDFRDRIDAAAADLGLEPGDALESAYESAAENFVEAQGIAHAELAALDQLAAADVALQATPDFLATVGLIGAEPRTEYEVAIAAFEAGDLAMAAAAAAGALTLVTDAPRVGRERLLAAVGVAFAGIAFIGIVIVIRGRRRAARARAALAAALPSPTQPYGTLAADSPAPAPDADRAGDPDGGTPDGDGSSAPP